MNKLLDYEYKKIEITTNEKESYEGWVLEVDSSEDSEDREWIITIETRKRGILYFKESEIADIRGLSEDGYS